METRVLAKVNNVSIVLTRDENNRKLIPIKPVCDALGIDEDVQNRKLKEDDFLSSVATLSVATGADGKQYEMVCLPYEFIFGWLFTINPKNVKEEARETVKKYRIECYKALFYWFSSQSDFLEDRQKIIDEKIMAYDRLREDFRTAEKNLKQARIDLYKAKDFTYEEWVASKQQQEIPFPVEPVEKEGGRS